MKIAIPKEGYGETRVAASPEVVKKLVALGFSVTIEKNAGIPSSFTDNDFKEAGATVAKDTGATLKSAEAVDALYEAGGGSSIYDENVLQRCFRDVHVTTQHIMVAKPIFEMTGKAVMSDF